MSIGLSEFTLDAYGLCWIGAEAGFKRVWFNGQEAPLFLGGKSLSEICVGLLASPASGREEQGVICVMVEGDDGKPLIENGRVVVRAFSGMVRWEIA